MHTFFLNNLFQLIILDMFQTNNCSSSGGLYKQLTVFYHAEIKLKLYEQKDYDKDAVYHPLYLKYIFKML